MDAGERRRELPRQRRPRSRIFGVAQQAARERLALDELHQQERRAEHGRILLAPAHARDRQAGGRRRAEQGELVAPARLDVMTGRIAAEDEPLDAPVREARVEGPDVARRAAGERAQQLDRDRGRTHLPREVGGQPLRELSRRDRGTPTNRTRSDRPTSTR